MFRRPRSEEGPYVDINLSQKQIIENIQYPSRNHFTNNRPDLDAMVKHSEIEPSVKTIGEIFFFFFLIKKILNAVNAGAKNLFLLYSGEIDFLFMM